MTVARTQGDAVAGMADAPVVGTTGEQLAAAADDAAQDAPATVPAVPRHVVADRYVHLTHPEHGEPVVFIPGERLPQWAVDELEATASAAALAAAQDAATREQL